MNLAIIDNLKDVSDTEDQKTLSGELEVTIKLIFFSVHASIHLYHHEESKHVMNRVTIKVANSS